LVGTGAATVSGLLDVLNPGLSWFGVRVDVTGHDGAHRLKSSE
jgi:hypothetical protein